MKINIKNPIVYSFFSIIVTFLVSITFMFLTKPSYIMEISKEGKKKLNICLLFIYSMLFAILIGTCLLLFRKESGIKKNILLSLNSNIYRPNQ
jgi:hypothetical protein